MIVHTFSIKFKAHEIEGAGDGKIKAIKGAVLEFVKEISDSCYDIDLKETSK